MPNQVKHATSTPNHSLHKGEVAIGVNNVGMGPTSSTGWYNGAIPTGWDYIIYKTTSGANPNIFAPTNEQEFYRFVLSQGGSTSDTTSIEAALAWIATQSDLLAFRSSLPNIVTDGLVTALDAQQISSYPTTGSTWYDLSGNGNDGTTQNGPTFNSVGGLNLDGVDDYISLSSPQIPATTDWTYSCWFNVDTLVAGGVLYGQYLQQSGNGRVLINLSEQDNSLCIRILSGAGYGSQVISSSIIPTVGKNYNFAISRNGQTYNLYVNGKLEISTTTSFTASFLQTTPIIGGRTSSNSNPTPTQNFFDGTIYDLKFYDTALTSDEILQNYYQSSIVTDDLVLAVDAGNLISYENGDTTTNSLTGSDTGTLTNGVGFDSTNDGSWVFDGVNDYINLGNTLNQGSSDFTVSVWVKLVTNNLAVSIILSKRESSGGYTGYSFRVSSTGYPTIIYDGTNNATNRFSNQAIYDDTWHNVVGVYNVSGNSMDIYTDGILTNGSSTGNISTAGSVNNTIDLTIGQRNSTYWLKGNMASCLLYSKSLTSEEVQQNFQAQSSRFI